MFDSKQVLLQTRPLFWCAEPSCLLQQWLEICCSKLCRWLEIDGFLSYGSSRSKDELLMLWQLLWMNRSLTVFQFSNCWKTKPRRADYLSDDNLGWSGHPGAFVWGTFFRAQLGYCIWFSNVNYVCVEGCKLFWGECLIVFWVLIDYVLNLAASCRKFCRLNWSCLA